jgi:hypothetical protein
MEGFPWYEKAGGSSTFENDLYQEVECSKVVVVVVAIVVMDTYVLVQFILFYVQF